MAGAPCVQLCSDARARAFGGLPTISSAPNIHYAASAHAETIHPCCPLWLQALSRAAHRGNRPGGRRARCPTT